MTRRVSRSLTALACPIFALAAAAPPSRVAVVDTAALRRAIQAEVDSFSRSGHVPGVTAAVALPNGVVLSFAAGRADTTRGTPMTVAARMPQGSVGKTYYAAIALQLIADGKLDPDALVSTYLGRYAWWRRIPNADSIRVRHLLTHTSGVMRYEFKPTFLQELTRTPYRKWRHDELLAFVFDETPRFAAGQGWEYSDTNYFLVGLIIEQLTGHELQDEVARRFLGPLGLRNTVANTSPRVPGIVQGYAGPSNGFSSGDTMILPDGRMAFDPDFEWAGGGYSSTAGDLAAWGHALYTGKAIAPPLMQRAVAAAVPANGLGPGTTYGYGVIVRDSVPGRPELGAMWGHSGFFPGYLTELRYYTGPRTIVTVMVNSSAQGTFAPGRSPGWLANRIATIATSDGATRDE